MNDQPRMFWIALIVSVVAHAAVVLGVYDMPLGYVDPALLQRSRQVYMVRRSANDTIIEPDRPVPADLASQSAERPSLAALSLALLQQATPPPAPAPLGDPQMRDVTEERPRDKLGEVPVDLAAALAEKWIGPAPPELEPSAGDVDNAAGAGLTFGPGPGDAAADARALLDQAGLLSTAGPLPPTHPPVAEPGPIDRRIIDVAPMQPSVDFAAIALKDTTQLAIPEHLDEDFDYKLTVWHDPKAKDAPYRYFRIDITGRRTLHKLRTMPKDVVFLIDVSGSVAQEWVDQVLRGVSESLASLNPDDRFNLVLFNDKAATFQPAGNAPVSEASLAAARAFITDARSQGYTDVNRALSRLLVRDVAIERVYDIILISDGKPTKGVMDTRALINLITRDNDLAASIYCVTIGREPNRELLDFLAYRNKGFSVVVADSARVAAAIPDLLSRLRYPIMKDVRVATIGLDADEVYPIDLPNIHQGEQFQVYGVFDNAAPFTMRVIGHNGQSMLDFTRTFDLNAAPQGDEQIARDWAFWKLHHLYSRIIQEGESRAILDQIKQLQRRYHLRTLY